MQQAEEHERWECEVVYPVDSARHLDLKAMVGVDFDEDLHASLPSRLRDAFDERKALGDHETRRSGPLDRVADRVETNEVDADLPKPVENRQQIGPRTRVADIEIDLLVGECCPDLPRNTGNLEGGERRPGTGPIDQLELLTRGTLREHCIAGKKHAVER